MKKIGALVLFVIILNIDVTAQDNAPHVAVAGGDVTTTSGKIIVIDAFQSYDIDNDIDDSSFRWYENEQQIGTGKILRISYPRTGRHFVTLKITDFIGLSAADVISIKVKEKETCKGTNAIYFPEDTICNNKWQSRDGDLMYINSEDYSCNLIEVCSDDLDYIVEDSIKCCSRADLNSPLKESACDFALQKSNGNFKKCQALYVTKGLGTDQVYMKDYLEAEMCCSAVGSLCRNTKNFYSFRPLPNSAPTIDIKKLKCGSSPENNIPGEWISDIDLGKNNLALVDLPAHVTINKLRAGTCVDFSLALTTLLRKIGYTTSEVYTVSTSNHAFNLVKFPLDKKFTLIDTTGTSQDIRMGKTPSSYKYCEELDKCWNDLGQVACPGLSNIFACENTPEDFLKKTERTKFTIKDKTKKLVRAIKAEAQF